MAIVKNLSYLIAVVVRRPTTRGLIGDQRAVPTSKNIPAIHDTDECEDQLWSAKTPFSGFQRLTGLSSLFLNVADFKGIHSR